MYHNLDKMTKTGAKSLEVLNFGRLKDWGLRIKGPEIRESGCMYIKKKE